MTSDNFLNLDELEYQEVQLGGVKYKFKTPATKDLGVLGELQSKTEGIEDPDKQMDIVALEFNKLIPELPIDVLKKLNSRQMRGLILFIVGSDEDTLKTALSKKK